jgi:hypothetical protein
MTSLVTLNGARGQRDLPKRAVGAIVIAIELRSQSASSTSSSWITPSWVRPPSRD